MEYAALETENSMSSDAETNVVDQRTRFHIVPDWLLDSGISDRATVLYLWLVRFASNDTGASWYARATLEDRLKWSRYSVQRALRELKDAGAITVTPRHREGGKQQSNLITLIDRTPDRRAEPTEPSSTDFDAFWAAYPKKRGKWQAVAAWNNAVKRDTPENIIAGAKGYAEQIKRDSVQAQYIKYPQGWLNDDRWRENQPLQVPERFAKSGWRLNERGDLVSADGTATHTLDPDGTGWTSATGRRYGRDGRDR